MRSRRLGLAATAAAAVAALLLVGCAGLVPSDGPPIDSPPIASREITASPATTSSPSRPVGSLEPTYHDPSLNDVLPPVVDGRPRLDDFETGAEMATDPGLQETIEAVALAVFANDDSYVVSTISRVRPGIFDDAFYRDWRDTFDEAVCEQAGGVDVGHGEVEIDERLVFRSACVGGVVIYHLHLDDPDTLISLQGAGPDDFGALVLDDLRMDFRGP